MNILVLGGTRFIGRSFVNAALANGHQLTLFNRGVTPSDAPASVRRIHGDRSDPSGVAPLAAGWDCVVDVSGYRPDQVRPVLHAVTPSALHYLYVSTVSVYAQPLPVGAAEDAPLLDVPEEIAPQHPHAYGALKACCERLLRDAFGARLTIVRPTVVIGPNDYTDRFTWWVRRIAAGGTVPVPRRLGQRVQLIDVRDLSAFLLLLVERAEAGIFNAVAPERPLTLGGMISTVSGALGVPITEPVDPAGDDGDLPLAIGADDDSMFRVSGAAAYARGLRPRPLAESARDVLASLAAPLA